MQPSAANPDPHADNHDDANLDLHGDRDRDGPAHGYADCDRNADANPERDRDPHRHRYDVADEYADAESIAKHNTNRDCHSMCR
jgi:hypothetical protein